MCVALCPFPALPSLSLASLEPFSWETGKAAGTPECQAPALLHRLQLGCRCQLATWSKAPLSLGNLFFLHLATVLGSFMKLR